MAGERISEEQKQRLDAAKRATRMAAFQELYTAIGELEPDEHLSQDWLPIWEAVRDLAAVRNLPDSVVARVRDALEGVNRVDDAVYQIQLGSNDKVVVFLGAGASAPAPSSIPTVAELLPELWRRAKKIGRDEIDRLAAWCEAREVTNIEDLLTAAYVADFAAKNATVTGLLDYFLFSGARAAEGPEARRERPGARRSMPHVDAASIALFQDTLQILFGLLTSTMIPAQPNAAHQAVAGFLSSGVNTSIVTTNYDGCIDEALIRADVGVNTRLEGGDSSHGVDLIKMHGSINWSHCDSCQEVRQFNLLDLKQAYADDSLSFAVIGICKTCLGQRRPLLVPPLAFKFMMFPTLVRLWNSARHRIEDADYLIVVGYSFSEADAYISKIISRSLTANPNQKMIVLNTDSSLVPSLRERYTALSDAFDSERVLQAVGSCDALLPEILESLARPPALVEAPTEVQANGVPSEGRPAR